MPALRDEKGRFIKQSNSLNTTTSDLPQVSTNKAKTKTKTKTSKKAVKKETKDESLKLETLTRFLKSEVFIEKDEPIAESKNSVEFSIITDRNGSTRITNTEEYNEVLNNVVNTLEKQHKTIIKNTESNDNLNKVILKVDDFYFDFLKDEGKVQSLLAEPFTKEKKEKIKNFVNLITTPEFDVRTNNRKELLINIQHLFTYLNNPHKFAHLAFDFCIFIYQIKSLDDLMSRSYEELEKINAYIERRKNTSYSSGDSLLTLLRESFRKKQLEIINDNW